MSSKRELSSYQIDDDERARIADESARFASGEKDPHVREVIRASAEQYGLRRQEYIESLGRQAVSRTSAKK